jgi:hypothetical protein
MREIGRFDRVSKFSLDGIVSFKVMPGKYCVGNILHGNHRYCFQKIDSGYQCNSCFRYNPFNFCSFCSGTRCYLKKKICGEHIVYLATFANILKVGVASAKRFPQRVIEQGADYATIIAQTEDGLEARRIESEIKKKFNITDKMYSRQKRELLHKKEARELGRHLITVAYADVIDTIPLEKRAEIDVLDLSENYVELEQRPVIQEISDNTDICGKVIGNKGNFLVLKVSNDNLMFNCYDLVGRVVRVG